MTQKIIENEIKIESLGYKKNIISKTFLYKASYEGNQYLIDYQYPNVNVQIFNKINEFEEADIHYKDINRIEYLIKKTAKKQLDISTIDLAEFFDKYSESDKKRKVADRNKKMFSEDEINTLFNFLEKGDSIIIGSNYLNLFEDEFEDLSYTKKEKLIEYYSGIFDSLIGYKIELIQEGDHRNDGQMVDYYMTLISPNGEETEIYTEMCLMVGFNHGKGETIK